MSTIAADPFDFTFDPATLALVVIDMQRDFVELGGFGASLGNDVERLQAIIPTVRRLLDGFRAAGLPIIHTRECHRPDLSDCPAAKRDPDCRRTRRRDRPGTAAIGRRNRHRQTR